MLFTVSKLDGGVVAAVLNTLSRIMDYYLSVKSQASITCVLLILAMTTAACVSSGEVLYNRAVNEAGKPNWVTDGTMTLTSSKGRAFVAVGSANTLGEEFALQATKANLRSKNEMEKMVSRFVAVTARDYIATGAAEDMGFTTPEVEANTQAITGVVMRHAHVLEHWVDNREKEVYAISEISYEKVAEIINEETSVNDGFKVFLNKKGQAIFDRIATDHDQQN